MSTPSGRPAIPFFLDAAPGKRFCLYHAPDPSAACRGALLYVHPFAEEMNKSRRMAALQSRAFASAGYAVLQIDLFGCGDSSGDFADARWEIWRQDLAAAHAWLQREARMPVSLWGLRLGALLALDFANEFPSLVHSLLLWQPILRGEGYLTQFLRLQLAADMLTGQAKGENGTRALRDRLQAGKPVEIAGYSLHPELAIAIAAADIADMAVPHCPVYWYELAQDTSRSLAPAITRIAESWRQHAGELHLQQVQSPAFWLTQEITESQDLIAATSADFGDVKP
ncbi:exosortase A-associated hydrolase 2 [Paucimonas lemoignei]|uniref:Exosortase A-associated hydrolase 2 n=1 Tax=Paucimonas lemoignei TaxID=29443 RepID=A0A4R3HZB7_PAULE|nr:hydrolase 2, exosortase A system-associated [Paucimonas lemoignei]TCS38588.1 exosortase A-associated hydrolase 2 [Paucimonas lemoignei]